MDQESHEKHLFAFGIILGFIVGCLFTLGIYFLAGSPV